MIRLTPALPIKLDRSSGSLIQISPDRAIIHWDQDLPRPCKGTLQITLNNELSYAFEATEDASGIWFFSAQSKETVTDLLHVLRKGQHLDLCAHQDVEHSKRSHGFEDIRLPVVALPELSWNELDLSVQFLGRRFSAPILITGMTGGIAQASIINERLAQAAVKHNVPMGVGSQRIALENPKHAGIFRLKDRYPNIFLIGNLGIGQLRHENYLDLCQRAVDMIEADALAIHINVLQELIQEEGDRDFRGMIDRIGTIQAKLKVPVIAKEVGAGLDAASAKKLWDVGIRAFDVGGAGGTSWSFIEGLRSSDPMIRRRGELFRDWGISTAQATKQLRVALPNAEVSATGGIRDGLTVLKAIYEGANMAGMGLPLMRAAAESEDATSNYLANVISELKIAMMCSGTKKLI